MTTQTSRSERRVFLRTALAWDLVVALIAGFALFFLWLAEDRLTGGVLYLLASVPSSLTIAVAAWVAARNVSDRLQGEYGELVRLVDPSEASASLPYYIVTYVAIASAAWSAFAAIVVGGVSIRWAQGVLHAFALFLFVWALAGWISLTWITHKDQQRLGRVRAAKEKAEAEERSRKQA